MMQKKDQAKVSANYFFPVFWVILMSFIGACGRSESGQLENSWQVTSPDGKIKATVQKQTSGQWKYQVLMGAGQDSAQVIEPSPLGIIRADQTFDTLQFISADAIKTIDENYTLRTGKKLINRNYCQELTLHFKNNNNAKLDVVFRAYNDGIAFKYVFPEEDKEPHRVTGELTGFNLLEGGAWMQPYDSSTAYAPAYERNFTGKLPVGQSAPAQDGWCFPALFEVNKHWALITEANLKPNYFASHLNPEAPAGLYTISAPEPTEAFGYGNAHAVSSLPWEMPWRVIIIGDAVSDIVESNLVAHVSDPSKIKDTSWIQPGRASWAWWSGYLDKTHYTPEKLKKFIDLAQTMGWEYSLIDAGWDTRPGFNLPELAAYAKQKNVKLLLWYNSGGPINRVNAGPRDLMYYPDQRKKEMKRIADLGVKGVKIDFFSSDKQDFIKLYHDILEDAVTYKLLVNFHGATLPRGWSRTYPNLISMESVKGSEGYIYHADFEEKSPLHNVILPFTRNVVGPMDYTPVAFSVQQVPHKTTYGFELALAVVYESGIQHFPDKAEVYLGAPAPVKKFLQQVPAAWDETRFVSGYPGKSVVLARRKGDTWYVGGINGEEKEKSIPVNFSFLKNGNYTAELITDGQTATSFASSTKTITDQTKEQVKVLPVGGFVMKIVRSN